MLNLNLTLPKLNKIYIRIVSSSVLAAIGLSNGWIPEILIKPSQLRVANQSLNIGKVYQPVVSFAVYAYSQEFTPEETVNYAKAGYEVEILRRQVYQEIKNTINQTPPDIVCDQQVTLNNLQTNVREIAQRYCTQSQQIVQRNNLTVDRFNQLKTYYDRRDAFYKQVQNVLIKLQN
ncbi:hypothetical protein NIES4102_02620 [Chondrocystis sp. NIES-4102]|nr:hypothetical protein NIES4102_02620 [Chondrocystis sp. NIES-4102]